MREFDGTNLNGTFDWIIPPSKSHIIRWLALGSQSDKGMEISFEGLPGEDCFSMAKCLIQMGTKIDFGGHEWFVEEGPNKLTLPDYELQCGNSGTTANTVSAMSACLDGDLKIDGDESLRMRESRGLCDALSQLGCDISSYSVPRKISGKITNRQAELDWSETSQGATAMALASPRLPHRVSLRLKGEPVSRGYWELTKKICSRSGGKIGIVDDQLIMNPWKVDTPSIVKVAAEESLGPMATLFSILHGVEVRENRVARIEGLDIAIQRMIEGTEVLDLSDASDIITPSAAIMAIGRGGIITGCAHARGKESNRISKTVEMLNRFGIKSMENSDGITIPGNQKPGRPNSPVPTYSDHRMAMTAMVLASKVGGIIEGEDCVNATDPGFMEQLLDICEQN